MVRNISMAEVITTRAQSLLSKFTQDSNSTAEHSSTDVHGFVSDLLEQPEVNIIGAARAPLGVVIHRLFIAAHKVCISCVPVVLSSTNLAFILSGINLLFHIPMMSFVTLSSLATFAVNLPLPLVFSTSSCNHIYCIFFPYRLLYQLNAFSQSYRPLLRCSLVLTHFGKVGQSVTC